MQIDFVKQFEEGAEAAKNVEVGGEFERVIFCGMGGSIIPAEVVLLLGLEKLNLYLHRAFGLPHWVNDKCLVICISWSGDTEETISSFKTAVGKSIPVAVVTKGGQLLGLARQYQVPSAVLPADNGPARLGAGYGLAALLTLLTNSAILDSNPVSSFSFAASAPEPISGLAARILDKIPLIYSSYQWRYLARFWKIFFNEDCKLHSFSNYFPGAAHNEIAGFVAPVPKLPGALSCRHTADVATSAAGQVWLNVGQRRHRNAYFPIILIDRDEDQNDIKKLEKFAAFLGRQGFDSQTVELTGQSRLEKIINNYRLAAAISLELAQILGIDPLDKTTIEQFKKN